MLLKTNYSQKNLQLIQLENGFLVIDLIAKINESDWSFDIKNKHHFQATYTDVNNIYAKNSAYRIKYIFKIIFASPSLNLKGVKVIEEQYLQDVLLERQHLF